MKDFRRGERRASESRQIVPSVELNERVMEQMINILRNNADRNGFEEWGVNAKAFMHEITKNLGAAFEALDYCLRHIKEMEYLDEILPLALRAMFAANPKLPLAKENGQTFIECVLISPLPDYMKYDVLLEIVSADPACWLRLRGADRKKAFIEVLNSTPQNSNCSILKFSAAIAVATIRISNENFHFIQQMEYFLKEFSNIENTVSVSEFLSNFKDSKCENIIHKLVSVADHAGFSMKEIIAIIEGLKKLGVDINAINDEGATPLILALENANENSAKLATALLDCGADPALGLSYYRHKALHLVIQSENPALIKKAIMKVGLDVFKSLDFNSLGYENYKAFMEQAHKDSVEVEPNYFDEALKELTIETFSLSDFEFMPPSLDSDQESSIEEERNEMPESPQAIVMDPGSDDEEISIISVKVHNTHRAKASNTTSSDVIVIESDSEEEMPSSRGPIRRRDTQGGSNNRYHPYNAAASRGDETRVLNLYPSPAIGALSALDLMLPVQSSLQQQSVQINNDVEVVALESSTVVNTTGLASMMHSVERAQRESDSRGL